MKTEADTINNMKYKVYNTPIMLGIDISLKISAFNPENNFIYFENIQSSY